MKISLVLLFFTLLFSCHQGLKKAEAPSDLLSHKKMKELTKELMLIEGHINLTYKQLFKHHNITRASSENVFKKHKVTKEQYVSSFEYYASHTEELNQIYSSILDELTIDKVRLEKK